MGNCLSALEYRYIRNGFQWIAGVDEVGRGPLAGPVVAAACLIPPGVRLSGIKDSKKLSAAVRKELFWDIISQTIIGIGMVDEQEIDRINILQASLLAMKKAVAALSRTPDIVFIDGHLTIDIPIKQRAVIKGDAKLISIGAASIVAKVTRDTIMEHYHEDYPFYGFNVHKGYPTKAHIANLMNHGPCPIHRRSFRPVKMEELITAKQELS